MRSAVRVGGADLAQFLRFVLVGGSTGLMWIFITYLLGSAGHRTSVASSVAFLSCVPVAYAGHRVFTFRSSQRIAIEFPKFFLKALLGLLIAVIVPEVAVQFGGGLKEVLWMTPAVIVCVGYLVARFWVFRK